MPDPYSLLLDWRRSEGSARGLSKLPRDFYASTAAYLEETRRSYEADLRENPSSRKGEISRQTHQRASQIARDIVEARISKLLASAFQASVGGSRDLPNALPEERALFERFVQSLTEYRRTAAPYLEPGGAAGPVPVAPVATPSAEPKLPTPASGEHLPTQVGAPPSSVPSAPAKLEYVRVLQDGRPIQIGRDTVELRREDVLAVPAATAQILVAGKIAERIRPAGPGPVT